MTLPLMLHLLGSLLIIALVRTLGADSEVTSIGWLVLVAALVFSATKVRDEASARGQ